MVCIATGDRSNEGADFLLLLRALRFFVVKNYLLVAANGCPSFFP